MCGDRELRERHTLALVGALLHGDIVLFLEFAGRLIYVFGTDGEVSESVVFLRGVAGIHSGAIFGFVALCKVQGVERMKGDGEKEGKKNGGASLVPGELEGDGRCGEEILVRLGAPRGESVGGGGGAALHEDEGKAAGNEMGHLQQRLRAVCFICVIS